jgi:hypothetical protein
MWVLLEVDFLILVQEPLLPVKIFLLTVDKLLLVV